MSRGSSQVDVVEACTCTHHNLQLLGSIEHLSIALVRTDDERIGILHSIEQLSLLSVFLEEHQLVASAFNFLTNTFNSSGCEGLFCCN